MAPRSGAREIPKPPRLPPQIFRGLNPPPILLFSAPSSNISNVLLFLSLILFFSRRGGRSSGCGNGRGSCFCLFGFFCLHFQFFLHFSAVLHEFSRRRKFAQAVPDHFFGNRDRNKILAVVHSESVSYHLRRDLRAP